MENIHQSYELIDSGEGRKLERFGKVVLDRPDPQIIWKKSNPEIWSTATARFDASWHGRSKVPKDWKVEISNLLFHIKLSTFKHIGVFPEQAPNWNLIQNFISKSQKKVRVLNLFGYTGGATLAALHAGAEVCHVDGSKTAIEWVKANVALNEFTEPKVWFMLDDVLSFVRREIRRGNTYEMIIMDPPVSGHGPKGEVWKIERDLTVLLTESVKLLSDKPLAIIVNGYASTFSAISYAQALQDVTKGLGGTVAHQELCITQTEGSRVLPAGISAHFVA